jgi:hypothetical protein|tara:strand:+ start:110 stop:262 length:153 start_codon:yes stop_codon:yes gene_type:complete
MMVMRIMHYFPSYTLNDVLSLTMQEINILGNMALVMYEEETERIKAIAGR